MCGRIIFFCVCLVADKFMSSLHRANKREYNDIYMHARQETVFFKSILTDLNNVTLFISCFRSNGRKNK